MRITREVTGLSANAMIVLAHELCPECIGLMENSFLR